MFGADPTGNAESVGAQADEILLWNTFVPPLAALATTFAVHLSPDAADVARTDLLLLKKGWPETMNNTEVDRSIP